MKADIRLFAASALATALFALPCAAPAQTTGVTWSAGAATDYRSKGLSKSDEDGYGTVAADWKSGDGLFYAGAAVATVDMAIGASWEADAKLGVRPKAMGWDFDFAAFYRVFPDSRPGADDDYVEFRAQASRNMGPVTVRLLTWQTHDNAGPVEAANWSEGRILWRSSPGIRASAALGRHAQDNGPDYSAWNAGVAVDLNKTVELDLRWYDTDEHGSGRRYDGEAVAALVARF